MLYKSPLTLQVAGFRPVKAPHKVHGGFLHFMQRPAAMPSRTVCRAIEQHALMDLSFSNHILGVTSLVNSDETNESTTPRA